MQWDLGLQGVATLAAMAVGFGVFAQALFWNRATWWVGIVAGALFFLAGIFISEVWFGWATGEDLQPNIDGLSFDEVLLAGLFGGIPLVLVARYLARGRMRELSRA